METTNEGLVIYRIKFKSKDDFEKAAQALRFGQTLGKYLESLQKSLGLSQSQANYPIIRPPEINICPDDFIIYVCSYEYGQHKKGSVITNNMTGAFAQTMPSFPYYYEAFLKGTFGGVSDLSITTEKGS
jgi:hypothetical protein